jgi:hypothetical protein
VVTVTASHNDMLYILVEDFEDLLSEIRCVNEMANESTSMLLRFKGDDAFEHARRYWTTHERLLFVTHHGSCNEKHKRGVYKYDPVDVRKARIYEISNACLSLRRSSSIRFEEKNLDAIVNCTYEELGDSSYASSLIRVAGGLADARLTHRLRRRIAYPRDEKGIESKISAFSFNIHQDFPPRDHVLEAS